MKGHIPVSLFMLFVLLVIAGCGSGFSTDKFALRAERENKTFPQRLNDSITVDSTTFDKENNTVSYYYSVTRGLDDPSIIAAEYVNIWNGLNRAIQNAVEMKDYLVAGCTIRYIYYSGATRERLAEFKFNPFNDDAR